MRAQAFVVLVHHRDLDRGARAAALVGEAQVALGLDRFAVMVAKAQGVDHCRGVFDLAIGADHGGLAVSLDLVGTTDGRAQALDHLRTEVRAVGANLWLQVFDKTATQPRVLDHHSQADHGHRLVGGLAAFNQGLFGVGDDLADFETHGQLPCRVGWSCCLMVYHNI
ncbi:hypothetical protein D3C81_1026300 [compost metagenome]